MLAFSGLSLVKAQFIFQRRNMERSSIIKILIIFLGVEY